MPPRKKTKFDWDAEVRRKNNSQPKIGNKPAKFNAEPTTLAWLHTFASRRAKDQVDSIGLERMFPWLWDPDWDGEIGLDAAGVHQLKAAVLHAEAMESSLDALFSCVQDRLARLRRTLKDIAPKSYFSLLSDDVLAMIFEFAAMPFSQATGDEYDSKSPSRISQVSRRFRAVALSLPRIWRYIDVQSDLELIASRSAIAGPILEVDVKSTKDHYNQRDQRVDQLYSFIGRISTVSSRITFLRFDLSLDVEQGFFRKLNDLKKYAKMKFPFLRELVLDYEGLGSEYRSIHFYRRWDIPALRVLRTRNVIPEFQSPKVLAEISECSFTLDQIRRDNWKFPRVSKFLSSLSGVKILDLVLHGGAMTRHFNCTEKLSLPSVERLRTAFPEMLLETVKDFVHAVRTPNKECWTIELGVEDFYMSSSYYFDGVIKDLFSFSRYGDQGRTDNAYLKEVDIVFYCEFPQENCTPLATISKLATELERLSVTYNTVAEQLRRFELNNCKGKVTGMLKDLEERFNENLVVANPHYIMDGSESH